MCTCILVEIKLCIIQTLYYSEEAEYESAEDSALAGEIPEVQRESEGLSAEDIAPSTGVEDMQNDVERAEDGCAEQSERSVAAQGSGKKWKKVTLSKQGRLDIKDGDRIRYKMPGGKKEVAIVTSRDNQSEE